MHKVAHNFCHQTIYIWKDVKQTGGTDMPQKAADSGLHRYRVVNTDIAAVCLYCKCQMFMKPQLKEIT